ncbi:MAG: flagellar hook assembly protein FlgD [Rickettsiales bacterium]
MTAATVTAANNALIAQKAKDAANAQANSASTTKTSDAKTALTSLSGDVTFFLKLLTTQLKNQDPTAPFDTTQLTQQIAQFSGVEQQVKTNSNLEKLITSNTQSQATTAVSYIGFETETAGADGQVVGGQGAFSYVLPSAASNVSVTLTNASGSVVFQGQGAKNSGRNILVWDGVNSSTGKQEPDGIYKIAIKASGANGKDLLAETRSVGIVSGVESGADGTVNLNVGTKKVTLEQILAVRSPTRITTSANNGSGSGA